MTAIAGLCKNRKVYMGGDSAGVNKSLDLSVRADRKVFKNGDFLFGFTSSFRMGQLLQYSLIPPKRYPEKDIFEFLAVDFINAVRRCLKNGGYAKKDDEVETGGCFLIGYAGRLFEIQCDYQVAEATLPFAAVGCGAVYILGSLYTSTGDPKKRILKALHAAQEFSAGVREPFYIESI